MKKIMASEFFNNNKNTLLCNSCDKLLTLNDETYIYFYDKGFSIECPQCQIINDFNYIWNIILTRAENNQYYYSTVFRATCREAIFKKLTERGGYIGLEILKTNSNQYIQFDKSVFTTTVREFLSNYYIGDFFNEYIFGTDQIQTTPFLAIEHKLSRLVTSYNLLVLRIALKHRLLTALGKNRNKEIDIDYATYLEGNFYCFSDYYHAINEIINATGANYTDPLWEKLSLTSNGVLSAYEELTGINEDYDPYQ